jgi:hypothetical protein
LPDLDQRQSKTGLLPELVLLEAVNVILRLLSGISAAVSPFKFKVHDEASRITGLLNTSVAPNITPNFS